MPTAALREEKKAYAAPSSVQCAAATEGYTAISSNRTLYVFNRDNGGVWQEYSHSETIRQMTFGEDGELYFRDERKNLYKLYADQLEEGSVAEDTQIDCTNVFFGNGALCYADYLNPYTSVFAGADRQFSGFYRDFAFDGDRLYALNDAYELYRLDLTTTQTELIATLPNDSAGLTIAGATAYAAANGTLYGYDLTTGQQVLSEAGAHTALWARGDTVYTLQNGEAYRYTPTDGLEVAGEEFALPHVKAIPTDGLQAAIENGQAAFSVVTTKENSLLVEVDLDQTAPYRGNERRGSITALKLGETGTYSLLAYRKSVDEEYKTYLVASNRLTDANGRTGYTEEGVGYTTNEVTLYRYPHLGYGGKTRVPRGAQITLVGEVKGLECAYYEIRYGNERGFLPKAYVGLEEGIPPTPEKTVVGERETNADGIWRLAYILLGVGAICILVDILILRKPRED